MAIPGSNRDREQNKFVESPTRPGQTAVEVVGQVNVVGPLEPPKETDTITRQVSGAVETYRYYQGGAAGTLLKTVVVTYTASNLKDLVSVEVV